jgi:hypothetical protein
LRLARASIDDLPRTIHVVVFDQPAHGFRQRTGADDQRDHADERQAEQHPPADFEVGNDRERDEAGDAAADEGGQGDPGSELAADRGRHDLARIGAGDTNERPDTGTADQARADERKRLGSDGVEQGADCIQADAEEDGNAPAETVAHKADDQLADNEADQPETGHRRADRRAGAIELQRDRHRVSDGLDIEVAEEPAEGENGQNPPAVRPDGQAIHAGQKIAGRSGVLP